MKKIFKKEIVIALTVIFSLTALFIGIDFLKGRNIFKPSNCYVTKFPNVTGLFVSSPVKINGFKVGIVQDMTYDYSNTGMVSVEMELDPNIKLPEGTTCMLSSDLLGTASVDIILGDNKSKFLESGTELPSSIKTGMMDKVNKDIMPTVESILPKLDSIMTNINALTANPALQTSVTRLDDITANFAAMSKQLNLVSQQLPSTMGRVNGITEHLDKMSADLAELSATLKQLPIDETMANVKDVTVNVKDLTTKLNTPNSTVGALLNDRQLYDHLDSTLSDLDSILVDLKKHPKKYVQFKLF